MQTKPGKRPALFSSLRFRWRILYYNRIITVSTFTVLVIYCASLILIITQFAKLPPVVPLWYSQPWGPERLAHPLWLFVLPIVGMLWYVIDVVLSVSIASEYLVFSQLLVFASVIVNVGSLVTLVKIITAVL
jgi:uncharacterized membrane protein